MPTDPAEQVGHWSGSRHHAPDLRHLGSTFRLFGIGSESVLWTPCDQELEGVVLADIMRLISAIQTVAHKQ
jgi:hypothetical protein